MSLKNKFENRRFSDFGFQTKNRISGFRLTSLQNTEQQMSEIYIQNTFKLKNAVWLLLELLHINSFTITSVIIISRFLQRPQKRSRGNQLIHRRLSQTKSIDSGSEPVSKAVRQS